MSATLNPGAAQQFNATVTGGNNKSVTWNVNGTAGGSPATGTVTSNGLYTAQTSVSGTLTANVQAVSAKDSSISATATVKVVRRGTASINRAAEPLPIELGTSGGNSKDESTKFCCSGTLGALVNRGGSNYILSANHVLARSGAGVAGDPIIQPGLVDVACTASKGHVVANLSQSAALKTSNVDAALALIVPGSIDKTGAILEFGSNGGAGMPAADATAGSVGMPVAKSGRSTGLTCSSISSVSTTVKVDYQQSCGSGTQFTVTFKNQLVINGGSFSSAGDSGALIVNSQSAQPIGLLYAGSDTDTVANPINDVLGALSDPSSGQVPAIVGGAQHSIDCAAAAQTASAPLNAAGAIAETPAESIRRAASVKQIHERDLLANAGVLGLGVGRSEKDATQPTIVIFVDKHQPPLAIPVQLDGVPTRVVYGERFRATGWNEKPAAACSIPKRSH